MKNRRNGKTTRIIDRCVQDFFNKGYCMLYDESRNLNITKKTLKVFENRLKNEHEHIKYTIELKKDSFSYYLIKKI